MKTKSLGSMRACLALGAAFIIGLCAIMVTADAEDRDKKRPSDADIVQGATETYASFTKIAAGTGIRSGEIPKQCWSTAIRDLKPLRVYTHNVNLVVVQKIAGNKEDGVYVYHPLSSYLPMDGADGFALTPKPNTAKSYKLGTGVFRYHRKCDNQIGYTRKTPLVAD